MGACVARSLPSAEADKPPARATARQRKLLRLVRRYQQLLGLERWDITVTFEPDKDLAGCAADDEYMRATLAFDLNQIPPEDDDATVRHEALHIVLWETVRVMDKLAGRDRVARELVRAARERCVTLLERAPLWARLA